jgi:hypothetical protein
MKLTTYLHSVPRLKMSGGIPSVSYIFMAFTGAPLLLTFFLTLEDGTDRLSQNINTELPLYAA